MPTNLTIANGLSAQPQRVQDAGGASSALSLSTAGVRLERAAGTEASILLTAVAPKENGTSPSAVFHSHSTEASIRMTATNATTSTIPNAFHFGTLIPGPGAEDKAIFFIWSDASGLAVEVDAARNLTARRNVTIDGTLNVRGMKAAEPTQLTSLKTVMIDPATGALFHA